jgi:excisionase family DNA binding protein
MADMQILFPMEPKEFWQKLRLIVEEIVIEHNNTVPLLDVLDKNAQRPLLKASEVCSIFKISKPTLYDWMNLGKLPSIKIESRRFFKQEDVAALIESSKIIPGMAKK